MYLLIPLNIWSFQWKSTPGNESCKLHKYLFITNSRLYLNGFILVYQYILDIFNCGPIKDITNNIIKAFTEFKVYFKYLYWPLALGLVNLSRSVSKHITVCYWPKNAQLFWYWFHGTLLESYYVSVCFLVNSLSNS